MDEKTQVIDAIYDTYDNERCGYLNVKQLRSVHTDIRIDGISYDQVEASIEYTCINDSCHRDELIDVLKEMDRRYFLIADLRWEFSMLCTPSFDTVTEENAKFDIRRVFKIPFEEKFILAKLFSYVHMGDLVIEMNALVLTLARWLLLSVHGERFSSRSWERFLRSRLTPGAGVSFAEIEVALCSLPTLSDLHNEVLEDERLAEGFTTTYADHIVVSGEIRYKRQKIKDQQRLHELEEQRRRYELRIKQERAAEALVRADEMRRKQEEQEERNQKLREIEESNNLERKFKDEELVEDLDAQRLFEEERLQDEEDAIEINQLYKEALEAEKLSEEEAERQKKRLKESEDEALRLDAEQKEKLARLHAKEYRHKKIRLNLKYAIKKRCTERLHGAMVDFKKEKLVDNDQDIPKAERILSLFKATEDLNNAMEKRDLHAMEKAMATVRRNNFDVALAGTMQRAHVMLLQLRQLARIRAEILELKQSTVAEIRSYQKPPDAVHTVMRATFHILGGHSEKELLVGIERFVSVWKTIQALVGRTGKEGLKRQCLQMEPQMLKSEDSKKAKALLDEFKLDAVRDVSAGAATFYLWSTTMIEEREEFIRNNKIAEEKLKEIDIAKKEKLLLHTEETSPLIKEDLTLNPQNVVKDENNSENRDSPATIESPSTVDTPESKPDIIAQTSDLPTPPETPDRETLNETQDHLSPKEIQNSDNDTESKTSLVESSNSGESSSSSDTHELSKKSDSLEREITNESNGSIDSVTEIPYIEKNDQN